jgi:AmpE protein
MSLIAILICIALQRYANIGGLNANSLFETYLKLIKNWVKKVNSWLGLGVVILPVLLVLGVLHFLSIWRFFGVFHLLLVVVILFLLLDIRDFKHRLVGYFAAMNKKDLDTSVEQATKIFGQGISHNRNQLIRAVTTSVLKGSFEKFFAIVFWFVIFGIYGAATYYIIERLGKVALKMDTEFDELAGIADKIHAILDWVPARLLGFSFALGGAFGHAFTFCCKKFTEAFGLKDNEKFVIEAGLVAIDADISKAAEAEIKENYGVLDLVNRVLIIWIVALLLFSLGTIF